MGGGGLLGFVFEVCEYWIEDAVNREGVIIVKVVVCGCLSMYMKAFYCVMVIKYAELSLGRAVCCSGQRRISSQVWVNLFKNKGRIHTWIRIYRSDSQNHTTDNLHTENNSNIHPSSPLHVARVAMTPFPKPTGRPHNNDAAKTLPKTYSDLKSATPPYHHSTTPCRTYRSYRIPTPDTTCDFVFIFYIIIVTPIY